MVNKHRKQLYSVLQQASLNGASSEIFLRLHDLQEYSVDALKMLLENVELPGLYCSLRNGGVPTPLSDSNSDRNSKPQ